MNNSQGSNYRTGAKNGASECPKNAHFEKKIPLGV